METMYQMKLKSKNCLGSQEKYQDGVVDTIKNKEMQVYLLTLWKRSLFKDK